MDDPLDQEAANADLISDIVGAALDRSSDFSDLARDLTSMDPAWREAWTVGPHTAEPPASPELIGVPPRG